MRRVHLREPWRWRDADPTGLEIELTKACAPIIAVRSLSDVDVVIYADVDYGI